MHRQNCWFVVLIPIPSPLLGIPLFWVPTNHQGVCLGSQVIFDLRISRTQSSTTMVLAPNIEPWGRHRRNSRSATSMAFHGDVTVKGFSSMGYYHHYLSTP